MKLLSLILVMFSTTWASADIEPMSLEDQHKYMVKVSKEIRKTYWVSGFQNVDSTYELMTKETLGEHVKKESNMRYEEPLDRDEIADLYRCHYKKDCQLYLVSASGSYHSGYGLDAHFILLNTEQGYHISITHSLYAE